MMLKGVVNPEDFALSSYDFALPESQIAQFPATRRGTSRLLVVNRTSEPYATEERVFSDILDVLPKDCLLVANNSRVIPARLNGKRASGGKVEFLLLSPVPLLQPIPCSAADVADYGYPQTKVAPSSITHTPVVDWYTVEVEGLFRSSKQVKVGEGIRFSDRLYVKLLERHEFGRCKVQLLWQGDLHCLLESLGRLPLPPYIRRPVSETGDVADSSGSWGSDRDRYQTIYGDDTKAGSVAAPTAGLHFTPELREAIIESGREWVEATLYVGYGTFSPVRESDIRKHTMHAEYVELPKATAEAVNRARKQGRPVVAIGTTSVRILEGVYRALYAEAAANESGAAGRSLQPYAGWVNLFLYPGQYFYIVDGLITNFHLPGSSLLMLVSAFAGRKRILNAYAQAVERGFRFFSYGDSMLIY